MTNLAYRIVFPGNPIPLARPRFGKYGVYDSQKDLKIKTIECLFQQKGNWQKLDGPIGVCMEFRMSMPNLPEHKRKKMLDEPHTKRPDLSNLIKYAEDCMQPHVFDDDCQIVECVARKINALCPETIIYVWRIQTHDDLQNQ